MTPRARGATGGRVSRGANGRDRQLGRHATSAGVSRRGDPRVRRNFATSAFGVAVAMVLLGCAGAGSAAAVDPEEIIVARRDHLDSAPPPKGSETENVPWRAVPVELKPTPKNARRRQGLGSSRASAGTTDPLKATPELLPSDEYVTTSGLGSTTRPYGTTIQDTDSAKPTAPIDATAAVQAAAAEKTGTRHEMKKVSARSLDAEEAKEAGWAKGTGEGGEFGISADWRYALSMPGGDGGHPSLRDEACLVEEKQEGVHDILKRRETTSDGSKVAVCVRTKDFGRFLPEWIAYHYAIGVEEMTVYDDDSIDDTKKILQPFVDAGMVFYLFEETGRMSNEMRPLNHCLNSYIARREDDASAPAWILFHDTDEYIFPVQTKVTISQALMEHSAKCSIEVPRVQYGTGGYRQMPRGLVLETFLTHANPYNVADNRIPKVMVNLAPDDPSLGVIKPPLKSMHNADGCVGERISVTEMRINHYLGSTEDYLQRTKRSWEEGYSHDKVALLVEQRDVNDETSDTITAWACATREVLYRIVAGIDLKSGLE